MVPSYLTSPKSMFHDSRKIGSISNRQQPVERHNAVRPATLPSLPSIQVPCLATRKDGQAEPPCWTTPINSCFTSDPPLRLLHSVLCILLASLLCYWHSSPWLHHQSSIETSQSLLRSYSNSPSSPLHPLNRFPPRPFKGGASSVTLKEM